MKTGILFDLDGTLLNTLEDLLDATNYALERCGYPRRTLSELRKFVGNGAENQIRMSLPASSSPEAVQQVLAERGLFTAEVTGYFGDQTEEAILKFQEQQGLAQTGVADEATLKRLGITIGAIPAATEANINLLARIISAEGRGEPYIGQVAIGAVIINRIEHPSFPDTLSGIIY